MAELMDTITSLAKRRGIVFQSSEIYGGLRSSWDYGPLGVELKRNVRNAWWRSMVQLRDDVVGLDSADHHVAEGLGGQRSRRGLHRPARRVPELPPAVPGRPPAGHPRPQSGHEEDETTIDMQQKPTVRTAATRVHRPPELQPDVQDAHGPGRGRRRTRSYLRPETAQGMFVDFVHGPVDEPEEGPVRDRPDRQVVPQRDHARELHLPHARVRADGDGVLRRARDRREVARVLDRRAHALVHATSACGRRTSASASTTRTSSRTTRSGRSTSSTASRSRTGASSRGSRTAPTSTSRRTRRPRVRTSPTSTRRRNERYHPYVIEPAAGVDRALLAFLIDAYARRRRRRRRARRRSGRTSRCTRTWRRSRSRCCRCHATSS